MMKLPLLSATLLFFLSVSQAATYDPLAQKNLLIRNADPLKVLLLTADNPKALFERYKPKLDSGSKITSPLQIGGTRDNPVIKVSIRKCVAFICQTVDLDAEVSLKEVRGNCDHNMFMAADLRRSSATLSDVYDQLDVHICFKQTKAQEGQLTLTAQARRAGTYSGGIVQKEILDFLRLQIDPITTALEETLKSNGSRGAR